MVNAEKFFNIEKKDKKEEEKPKKESDDKDKKKKWAKLLIKDQLFKCLSLFKTTIRSIINPKIYLYRHKNIL